MKKRLAVLHYVKVVLRLYFENRKHIIQHLPVLRANANPRLQIFAGSNRRHHRRHFNGLRPRAKYNQNLFLFH
jgi:hypothetical protein